MSINQVTLVGIAEAANRNEAEAQQIKLRSGKDSGRPYVRFRVQTEEPWTDKATGEHRSTKLWHTVYTTAITAERVSQTVRPGDLVSVVGLLKNRRTPNVDTEGRKVREHFIEAKSVSNLSRELNLETQGLGVAQPQQNYQQQPQQPPQAYQAQPAQAQQFAPQPPVQQTYQPPQQAQQPQQPTYQPPQPPPQPAQPAYQPPQPAQPQQAAPRQQAEGGLDPDDIPF